MSGPTPSPDELARLRERLDDARERVEALGWQLREERRRLVQAQAEAEARLAALHDSWSWRVTAPLRWLHGLWTGRGRGAR